jgi:hypothetical protein
MESGHVVLVAVVLAYGVVVAAQAQQAAPAPSLMRPADISASCRGVREAIRSLLLT